MKKRRGLMLIVLMLFVMAFAMPVQAAKKTKIKLNKKQATIYVGETVKLKVKGTKKKVIWSSSIRSIATVSKKGLVTGISPGVVTIKAKVAGKRMSCTIAVLNRPTDTPSYTPTPTPAPITWNRKLRFAERSLTLKIDETKAVSVQSDGYSMTWQPSDNCIRADQGGWNGTTYSIHVTGLFKGTSTLTVWDNIDTSVRDSITINVVLPDLVINYPSLPKTVNYYSGSTLSSTCKIESIEIEKETYYSSSKTLGVRVWITGTKTYDKSPTVSSSCKVAWKVYDPNNIVLKSGTFYSTDVAQGERFRGNIFVNGLSPDTTYRLEFLNVI